MGIRKRSKVLSQVKCFVLLRLFFNCFLYFFTAHDSYSGRKLAFLRCTPYNIAEFIVCSCLQEYMDVVRQLPISGMV